MSNGAPRTGLLPSVAVRPLRFVRVVLQRFYDDGGLNDASALAYTTLLALVPLLALIFAVLNGLGAHALLQPSYLTRFGLDHGVAIQILTYIENANVTTLGFMGAAALIVTVIGLLGTIEGSFNRIWRVRESRNLVRQVSDYVSVVFLTPLLLLAAAAITSSLYFRQVMEWLLATQVVGDFVLAALRLVPIAINSLALGILYTVMPNRRAAPFAIAVAALVAGFSWQVVQATYLAQQIGLARYSALYGALAQLPFTLVWLYVSWVVILLGAQIAAVLEFGIDRAAPRHAAAPASVALHLLVRAADAFRDGPGPVDARALGAALAAAPEVADRAAAALQERGWLAPVEGGVGLFVLARAPESIHLGFLAEPWDGSAAAALDDRVQDFLAQMSGAEYRLWEERSLASVLAPPQPPADPPHLDKPGGVG